MSHTQASCSTVNDLRFVSRAGRRWAVIVTLLAFWTGTACGPVGAADWPTFMRDAQRSGITSEALSTNLGVAWVYPRVKRPHPAWHDEAKRDYSVDIPSQRPFKQRNLFDRVNHVAVSGGRVYLASATDHTIQSLDTVTGEPRWTFFTDGPARMAPTVDSGRVYAGSDDGSAYCLDAVQGTLVWKYTPAGPTNYWVPNNGQPVSPWAVRSGILVDRGTAYFAAGIFPSEGVYLCAVDALSGQLTTTNHWRTRHVNQGSMQGYLLLSGTRVYVPGGRSNPFYFNRSTGALLGQYNDREASGTFALLAGNSFFYGRSGRTLGRITESGSAGDTLATYDDGNAMVVTTNRSYLLSDTALKALSRPGRATVWTKPVTSGHALILAGTTLWVGGDGEVSAHDAVTGNRLWASAVSGRAAGLAVADGRLFVSTDEGLIYSFAAQPGSNQNALIVR
jgi:outer membrane protein assembly factor BamB